MRAGLLNSLVTIQKPSSGQDDIGQPVATWVTLATVWANIRHKSGSESIRADQNSSAVQASIRIRRRTDVTAAMRVLNGSMAYNIVAVIPDPAKNVYTDLVCEAVNG